MKRKERLAALTLDSREFRDRTDAAMLEQLLQSVTRLSSLIDVERVLDLLVDSPYASTPGQKDSARRVREWFRRNRGNWPEFDPEVAREALQWEVGWLRRLARIRSAEQASDSGVPQSVSDPRRRLRYGSGAIVGPGSAAQPRAVVVRATPPRQESAPSPLMELPPQFEARFADWDVARRVWSDARLRMKAKQPPKDIPIQVVPADRRLTIIASGLYCSIARTEGCSDVLEQHKSETGSGPRFTCLRLAPESGRRRMIEKVGAAAP